MAKKKKTARRAAKSTKKKKCAPRRRRPRRDLAISRPHLQRRDTTEAPVSGSEPTVPHGLVREWTRTSSEPADDYRIFKMRRDVSIHPRTGATHKFVVMEGVDWVNVIPITAEGNVVFIEQYRHGIRQRTLEIPGGMVDTGETPAQAASRELLEETGYAGAKAVELGWIHPNPAIQENRCWSYLVRPTKKIGPAQTEGSEDIATIEVPLADVPRLIAARRITHALVVVAFQWLWLREGRS